MKGYQLYRRAWRYDEDPHLETKLDKEEVHAMLRKGGIMVRNTYHFDQSESSPFWFVIKDQYGGMEELNTRDRNKVKKAYEEFDFRLIDILLLREKGYPIVEDTYRNYKVHNNKMNQAWFDEYLNQCEQNSFDYWGIFEKENQAFVGFCAVHHWKTSCEYGVTALLNNYKSGGKYPYYGLYDAMNCHYLQEERLRYVSDGTRTITNHSQIQDFLEQHFGFRKAYCKLEVYYCWWMKLAVTLLFPIRKWIHEPNVKAVLKMEEIRREMA